MIQKTLILVAFLAAGIGTAEAQSGKKGAADSAAVEAPQCGEAYFTDGAMVCSCPANATAGSVWGSGPYTADSDVCTAAFHAGVIAASGGVVHLTEEPGRDSYSSSSSNGVTTASWGSFGQSFGFVGAKPSHDLGLPVCATIPSGIDEYQCHCPDNPTRGALWGDGPYTADSDICTAAVHSGVIDDQGGDVTVLRVQGLPGYHGSESNGVASSEWSNYAESIIFDRNR